MTLLSPRQQERVARALVREYASRGVGIDVARSQVATGEWDDHPAAGKSGAGAMIVEQPRAHRVRVYLDDDEVRVLDDQRGETSRSAWMARAAGLRR